MHNLQLLLLECDESDVDDEEEDEYVSTHSEEKEEEEEQSTSGTKDTTTEVFQTFYYSTNDIIIYIFNYKPNIGDEDGTDYYSIRLGQSFDPSCWDTIRGKFVKLF